MKVKPFKGFVSRAASSRRTRAIRRPTCIDLRQLVHQSQTTVYDQFSFLERLERQGSSTAGRASVFRGIAVLPRIRGVGRSLPSAWRSTCTSMLAWRFSALFQRIAAVRTVRLSARAPSEGFANPRLALGLGHHEKFAAGATYRGSWARSTIVPICSRFRREGPRRKERDCIFSTVGVSGDDKASWPFDRLARHDGWASGRVRWALRGPQRRARRALFRRPDRARER